MAVKIDIFGSCVCRDVFRHVAPGKYEINRCIGNVPVTTLYEPQIAYPNFDTVDFSNYEEKMLKIQLRKNAVDLLKKSDAENLVIDFADEFMKRVVLENSKGEQCVIAQMEGKDEEYVKLFQRNGWNVKRNCLPVELDIESVEKKIRRFARSIVRSEKNPSGYPEKNIIVFESLYTADILGNDGNIHAHDSKYRLHEYNEWLRKVYMMFYKYCQDCKVIKLPEFVHSSENHLRGIHPLHYMENTYGYFEKAMDVLNTYSQVNTVENLYKEQSLINKLETRVVNSSMMYGLKGQVNSLSKELAELKKLIQEQNEAE